MSRSRCLSMLAVVALVSCGDPAKPVSSITDVTPKPVIPADVPRALPAMLAFRVQPASAVVNEVIAPAVEVAVLDSMGNFDASSSTPVTIVIKPYQEGVLQGTTTVNAQHGVARFTNLRITRPAVTWSLIAYSPGRHWVRTWMFPVTDAQ